MRPVLALLLVSLVAACADARSGAARPPQLETGITSSNGGGARALGNQPGASVTTRVGPAQ